MIEKLIERLKIYQFEIDGEIINAGEAVWEALLWRDMATAPRDGTKILIDQREFEPDVFYWMGDGWRATDWEGSPVLDPVGWMPLPAKRKL